MFKNNRVLKLVILTIVFIVGVILYSEYFVMNRYFEENIKNEQQMISKMYNQKVKELQYRYKKRMENVLSFPAIKEGIKIQNTALLKKAFIYRFKKIQNENKFIKTMLITDENNVVMLRAHKPEMYGDDLTYVRPIIKKVNEIKKTLFGFEAGKMSIPYRITVPIIYDGIHYGALDLGISSNFFVNYINKISSSAHVTSLLNKDFLKNFIKTTYLNETPLKKGFLAPNFNKFFEPFFDKIDLDKDMSQVDMDGKIYLINTTFKMTSFDKTPFGIILVSNDITDSVNKQHNSILLKLFLIGIIVVIIFFILKYYETELKNQIKSYKILFQNSADGILIIKDGKFIDCNKVVIDMLKYKNKSEILNLHPSQMSPKIQPDGQHSLEKANKLIDLSIKNGPQRFEWVYKKSDNENFWCEVSLTPMQINGKDIIHTTWRDITAIKNMENISQKLIEQKTKEYKEAMQKAQSANIAKSQFLANMSHEIRTPLNAIMGFISLLKENEENEEKVKYLKTIDTSSNNLLEIINDILDFSKIESNQIELEYRNYNPLDEFESIAELFKANVLEKDITFLLEIDKNLPYHINSDSLRIKQVVINLLSNAVKFTSQNKKVSFKVIFKDEELSVYIKDEGIGISKDKLQSIFEPFTQADNSTTRKFGGTGLGLTISSKLIEALGGELKVKSEVGAGSEFYFTIPVKTVDIKETEKEIINNDKKLSGHILLVEDNTANQMFMKVILKKIGFTFDIAFNGLEAIEKFPRFICECGETKYDIILMDENMPNMNGIEATKRILEIEKAQNLPHTPIIALTANALKGDRKKFLEAGMDEYLTKPINKKKLSEILGRFINVK
jgi:PAS domain S-box-containing protein